MVIHDLESQVWLIPIEIDGFEIIDTSGAASKDNLRKFSWDCFVERSTNYYFNDFKYLDELDLLTVDYRK